MMYHRRHVDIQAAAQKWVDSPFPRPPTYRRTSSTRTSRDYLYAYDMGLKGCTTFRFNPEAFQGVLVKEKDLENTL